MDDQSQNKNTPQDPTLLPIPKELPILPLHGFVFFPGMGFPLQIASATSKQLVDEALEGDRMVGLVLCHKQQVGDDDTITSEDLHRVGAVGYVHKVSKTEEGYYQVLVSGIHKLSVDKFTQETPYIRGKLASFLCRSRIRIVRPMPWFSESVMSSKNSASLLICLRKLWQLWMPLPILFTSGTWSPRS